MASCIRETFQAFRWEQLCHTCDGVADEDRDHAVGNVLADGHWSANLDAKGDLQQQKPGCS